MASWNFTHLDNVLASSLPTRECPPKTDHMPITTTIEMSPGRQATMPKPNFKATNWPYFLKELTKSLPNYAP